jgi:hypothetical protein
LDYVVYNFKQETLEAFIGDLIIKTYKKENVADQKIILRDGSRDIFAIKIGSSVASDNKCTWVKDAKGVKITKLIISPSLQEIINEINKQSSQYNKKMKKADHCKITGKSDNMAIILEEQMILNKLIVKLKDIKFSKKIVKYIAHHFQLDVILLQNAYDVTKKQNITSTVIKNDVDCEDKCDCKKVRKIIKDKHKKNLPIIKNCV